MAGQCVFAAMAWLTLMAAASAAGGLSEVDRSIREEPVYESKQPLFCLLVFGLEAKVRVWLVLDGDWLYVDRNGNGNLTDPGERISPLHVWRTSPERPHIEVIRAFELQMFNKTAVSTYREPILSCMPKVAWLFVEQFVPRDDYPYEAQRKMYQERPFRVTVTSAADWQQDAQVAFADRPQDAPILHFLGPQQVTWAEPEPLRLQKGEWAQLFVGLKTPGLNATVGTYRGIPDTAHCVADVELPARERNGNPIYRRVELKEPGG